MHAELPAREEALHVDGRELGELVQLGAYGTPHRDPRGHTVGVAFLAVCGPDEVTPAAGDDAADCRWFDARRPPELAFDHGVILRDACGRFAALAARPESFAEAFRSAQPSPWLELVREAARAG